MQIFADKRIRKQLIELIIVFSFQELVNVLIGTINSTMLGPTLGHDAEKTISAVGFAFQIFLLLNITMSALVYISNLFYSQHYGRGDIPQVEKDFCFCQKVAFFIGFVFFILSVTIPYQLIDIFTDNKDAIKLGGDYLRIFGISFLFMPLSLMNYSLMKNTRLELQASISAIVTLLIVVICNSIFLYGLHFGPNGAALSIVIARFIELVTTTIIIKLKCVVKPTLKSILTPDFSRFRTSSKIMAPIFAGKFFWGLGCLGAVIIIGLFEDIDLDAANQLMLIGQNLVNCFCAGISVAVGVIVGRELGANRLNKAKETGHDILKFAALYGLILTVVFMIFLPFTYLFNQSITSTTLLYMLVLFGVQATAYIPRVYNCVIVNGMLFTGGDSLFPSLVDCSAYWILIFPFCIISLKCNWHPIVPLILIQIEEGIKTPLFYLHWRKHKWMKNLTNKEKRGLVFN